MLQDLLGFVFSAVDYLYPSEVVGVLLAEHAPTLPLTPTDLVLELAAGGLEHQLLRLLQLESELVLALLVS